MVRQYNSEAEEDQLTKIEKLRKEFFLNDAAQVQKEAEQRQKQTNLNTGEIQEGWQVRELLSDIKAVNYERENRIFGISPSRQAKKSKKVKNPPSHNLPGGKLMQGLGDHVEKLLQQE